MHRRWVVQYVVVVRVRRAVQQAVVARCGGADCSGGALTCPLFRRLVHLNAAHRALFSVVCGAASKGSRSVGWLYG